MREYLRRHVGEDWVKLHVADFFDQLVDEISHVIAGNPNPYVVSVTLWDLQTIFSRYPGSKKGQSYKLWRDPLGKQLTYTPTDITNEQLIQFSDEIIERFGQGKFAPDTVWRIPENQRILAITAFCISGLMKKIPLKDTPTEIKFQLKEPEEDIVWAVLAGIFYRRPHPDEPPFVEVGDIVEERQPLCILEAQKVFNTILAERKMRILEIVAQDESLVQAGDILFRVEISEI